MIEITRKEDCAGCWACVQRCPKRCISMHEDNEGFLYPTADAALCIDCGLCEKVCPVINQAEKREPKAAYAATNREDAIRLKSSSGGIFSALSEEVVRQGGVVFGARFDKQWEVVHDWADTSEKLTPFRCSKYVQSRIGDSYVQAEKFLKEGRTVLFSGTPCQIAGLRLFLRKTYENLLLVDIICHGVPSPGVWRDYLNAELKHRCGFESTSAITSISFRDKSTGWKSYSFTYTVKTPSGGELRVSEPGSRNTFMRGFLMDLYLRPSCDACPAKHLKSGSDLTLGDYWGLEQTHPELDDNKGMCALMVNTGKGARWVAEISGTMQLTSTPFSDIARYNPSLFHSSHPSFERSLYKRLHGVQFMRRVETVYQCRLLARRWKRLLHLPVGLMRRLRAWKK